MGGFYRKGVPGAGLGTLWAGLASTLDWPRAGWLLSALGTLLDLCHRLSCGTRSGLTFRVALRLPRNGRTKTPCPTA